MHGLHMLVGLLTPRALRWLDPDCLVEDEWITQLEQKRFLKKKLKIARGAVDISSTSSLLPDPPRCTHAGDPKRVRTRQIRVRWILRSALYTPVRAVG